MLHQSSDVDVGNNKIITNKILVLEFIFWLVWVRKIHRRLFKAWCCQVSFENLLRGREKHSQHQSIRRIYVKAPALVCGVCVTHFSLSFSLRLFSQLDLSELKENREAAYLDTIWELSGLKKAESKWESQRGREDSRDYQLIQSMDSPDGAWSFHQDDAGLLHFTLMAVFLESISLLFPSLWLFFIASQSSGVLGAVNRGKERKSTGLVTKCLSAVAHMDKPL